MFDEEKALDYLIILKIVSRETSHPGQGYFNAVLPAMHARIRVPDSLSVPTISLGAPW